MVDTPRGSTLEPLLRRLEEYAGREQTGSTPLHWLHRARVRQAQHLKRVAGVSPQAYRKAFR